MDLALLRSAGRARAGHHHRCRLPLFLHRQGKFIIADTATGAIILVDARYGVQTQTRRHSYIASLLGIKHIVVAVNKMDLKNFDEQVFESIKADYLKFAEGINLKPSSLHFVPMSALKGDNVVNRSERSPWYTGPALMEILETVEVAADRNFTDLRFPVQYVNRPNLNFRGFAGTIASGVVHKGTKWSCCRRARAAGSSPSSPSKVSWKTQAQARP